MHSLAIAFPHRHTFKGQEVPRRRVMVHIAPPIRADCRSSEKGAT